MQASSNDVDVVVVGGGPAGAVAASALALDGRSVIVVERDKFPRYHIGESLLPATIHGVCEIIGAADAVHAAGFTRKAGGCFRWGSNPELWTFRFADQLAVEGASYAYQVERSRFDEILLRNAARCGADVREGVAAEAAIRDANGRFAGVRCRDATGSYEIRSRYVVDASGQAGLLANVVGRREYDSFFKNMALFGYFAGGRRLPPPNEGNIISAAFSKGWLWYIPLRPDLTSVGVVLPKDNLPLLRNDRHALYRSLLSECPLVADMIGSVEMVKEGPYSELRVLRDFSFANQRYFADGAVLIGDAACFIDPVFSSGVHLATLAGLHAARAINSCIADGMAEELAFTEFERRYRREFGVFYQFLVAFYDVHQDEESYFWAARKIVSAAESNKDAFIRLVAGVSSEEERFSSIDRFIDSTTDESRVLTHASMLDSNWAERDPELAARALGHITALGRERGELIKHGELSPIFAGGLVPSPSRLRWQVREADSSSNT